MYNDKQKIIGDIKLRAIIKNIKNENLLLKMCSNLTIKDSFS